MKASSLLVLAVALGAPIAVASDLSCTTVGGVFSCNYIGMKDVIREDARIMQQEITWQNCVAAFQLAREVREFGLKPSLVAEKMVSICAERIAIMESEK